MESQKRESNHRVYNTCTHAPLSHSHYNLDCAIHMRAESGFNWDSIPIESVLSNPSYSIINSMCGIVYSFNAKIRSSGEKSTIESTNLRVRTSAAVST